MTWLGVRCWKERISLVAIDDPRSPSVVLRRRQPAPIEQDAGARVAWFAKVVAEAIAELGGCDGVGVRVADTDPDQLRAEAEGAVLHAAHAAGVRARTFRRQSMLKPLAVASGAGAWKEFQRADEFIGSLIGDEKDAAMAAVAVARA